MRVADWFLGFVDRHFDRHPRPDWPRNRPRADGGNPEFYSGWLGNFIRHGITEDAADEASMRLMADPPDYAERHIPALIKLCRTIYHERAESGEGHATDSREAALLASRDCADCVGGGLTVRWRRRSPGDLDARGNTPAASIVLYCVCPLGRWIERAHRKDAPDVRKRLLDLADHGFLQLGPVPWSADLDNEYRYPAECWDDYHARPLLRDWPAIRAESALTDVRDVPRRSLLDRIAALKLAATPNTPEPPAF